MTEINCAEACINGCVLGDNCPNLEYKEKAAQFIQDTSLDKMLEMADEAVRKKMLERASQPPKWVLPED
jgi:iron only hydrogenase large subunit-like protein